MAVSGGWVGFALSRLQTVTPNKLLNIAGIIYGMLGVVVLAEFVVKNDVLKRIMVSYVAGTILWASTLVPLGMLLGSGLAFTLGLPSAAGTAKWAIAFVIYSMLPLSAIDATVVSPTRLIRIDLHGKHQILGLALVLGGGMLQLIAAILDLVT